jgi:hypothetical protein
LAWSKKTKENNSVERNGVHLDGFKTASLEKKMTHKETSRIEFEGAYARLNGSTPGGGWNDYDRQTQQYCEVDIQDAWLLWQAAQLSSQAQLAESDRRVSELEARLQNGLGELLEKDWAVQYHAANGSKVSWLKSGGYTTLYGSRERAELDCLSDEYEPRSVALYALPLASKATNSAHLAIHSLRKLLIDAKYQLEKARVWSGMVWSYNPLPSIHYLPVIEKIDFILSTPSFEKEGELGVIEVENLLTAEVLQAAALAVESSANVWTGFAINDAKTCIRTAITAALSKAR